MGLPQGRLRERARLMALAALVYGSSACGRLGFESYTVVDAGIRTTDAAAGVDGAVGGNDGGAPENTSWLQTFASDTYALAAGLTSNAAGSAIYVVGDFEGTFQEPGGGIIRSQGIDDAFALRLDGETGDVEWSRFFPGPGFGQLWAVGYSDRDDRIIATGVQSLTADYDGQIVDAGARQDALLVELNASGGVVSARSLPGDSANVQGRGLAVDDGVVAITGVYGRDLSLPMPAFPSAADDDAFLAVWDDLAQPASIAEPIVVGGTGLGNGVGIGTSHVCAVGRWDGTLQVGPDSYTDARGQAYVASFARDGTFRWSEVIGGPGSVTARETVATPDGGCVVVGEFQATTLEIGAVSRAGLGAEDAFITAFDGFGAVRWAHVFGGGGRDIAYSVARGVDGSLYVAGHFSGEATFGALTDAADGGRDGFVARVSDSGNVQDVRRVGGTGNLEMRSVQVAGSSVFAGGIFEGTIDFAGTQRTAINADGFALRMDF